MKKEGGKGRIDGSISLILLIVLMGIIAGGCNGDDGAVSLPPAGAPPAEVAAVEVNPATSVIRVGTTQQFTATAKDASGNPLTDVPFTWSSNTQFATVSETGFATGGVTAGQATITATATGTTISGSTFLTVICFDETEPNNEPLAANPITIGSCFAGVINPARDRDFFQFSGTAGQTIQAEITAARVGSPLDSRLTLFASDGKAVLIENDDFFGPDSFIEFILPLGDTFFLRVESDRRDAGGQTFTYQLDLRLAPSP